MAWIPSGRIVKYDQILEEGAPGAHLSRIEALERVEQFLRDTLNKPLEAYTFLREEANSFTRPNRTDWSFTWERSGFRAQDAPYRLRVTLQGDRIGGYEEFLKVPEAWQRDFARMRSSNEFLTLVAAVPYALLLGGALAVLLALGRRGQTRWRSALKLGLFIAALYFLTTLNQWPLTRASYDTNSAYSSFVVSQMALAMASSVLLALLVVIAVLPGEPIYRAGQPDRLRLNCAFTLHGLRTKEFFRSGVIGICLAGAHIGFVVLFYVAGRRFGVWAPQDLQYSDTLSTVLPWIYPLTIGIYAAASEEFLFRLFAIRFLLRATKSKFLAIVLPALAWGFLHANYPQEPGYIRGIEVGLIGIVAGMVMLRWGIVATLIWHFAVDAFLVSLPLMRSGDLYGQISGTLVGLGVLIPVGIAGVLYLVRGGFADQTELLNRAEPLVEAPPAPVEEVVTTRLAPDLQSTQEADARHAGRLRCPGSAPVVGRKPSKHWGLCPFFRRCAAGRSARRRHPAASGRWIRRIITGRRRSDTRSTRWSMNSCDAASALKPPTARTAIRYRQPSGPCATSAILRRRNTWWFCAPTARCTRCTILWQKLHRGQV